MSLEVQQQPRGRQPPDHELPQRTDGAARKVRHDARALLRRDRAGARQRVHHQHDRRQHAVAPVRVGRLRHGQTLVDRRAEIGVADARVRVRVAKCRERRKERAETRLRLQAVKLGAVRANHRQQLQALLGQHDVRHARQQRQRVQRAGDTRVALLLEFGRHGDAVRSEQSNDRIDQRARVEDARIDDVLQCRLRTSLCRATCSRATPARASGADRRTTARPSRRRRPNRSSSTCAPPTQRWQHARRVCESLPSFDETRRGIRRHGDARLGAAKRVERDAKLRQQHRRLRHAHRIVDVDGERVVDVLQNTM
jgi:hypothetical protein